MLKHKHQPSSLDPPTPTPPHPLSPGLHATSPPSTSRSNNPYPTLTDSLKSLVPALYLHLPFFFIISLLPTLMAFVYSPFLVTAVADDLDLLKYASMKNWTNSTK